MAHIEENSALASLQHVGLHLACEAIDQLDLSTSVDFFRAITLLYWLRFAATNLSRYPAFQRDSRWLKHNVFLVLKRGI